jgi:hypothetical protein
MGISRCIIFLRFASSMHQLFCYALMLEKFRIWNRTNYSRVLYYLDGDILMPLCSLDYYIFEISYSLRVQWTSWCLEREYGSCLKRKELANGAFFMLQPNQEGLSPATTICHLPHREQKGWDLPWRPHQDPKTRNHSTRCLVWRSPDGVRETNWTWHGVVTDHKAFVTIGKSM